MGYNPSAMGSPFWDGQGMADDWREQIETLLQNHNLNMKAVSLAAGRGETFVRDILKRDRTPSTENLRLVMDAIARLSGRVPLDPATDVQPADVPPIGRTISRDIEVLGSAAGSDIGRGSFRFSMEPIDRVGRPPGLVGAKGVYAVYVENDSMSPKYDPGDLVYVSQHRPAAPGDVVIVQNFGPDDEQDFSGFIKILVRKTADWIETRQLNPAGPVKFRNHKNLLVHRVYTNNELYGI